MNNMKIGVLDSGVGGLTVVKELEQLLPKESIVYFGDNANCPYGNRTEDNIVELTKAMLDFLKEQHVKVVAVACNTISTLIERYQKDYDFPIFSIVQAASDYTAASGIKNVGVFATEFTIRTGCYTKLIHEKAPDVAVTGEPSRNLAALVDCGEFDMQAIEEDVSMHMNKLLEDKDIKRVILGCTHFPIIKDVFEKLAPTAEYINPAYEQARAVKEYLEAHEMLCDGTSSAAFDIYTSGTEKTYQTIIEKLGIERQANIHTFSSIK